MAIREVIEPNNPPGLLSAALETGGQIGLSVGLSALAVRLITSNGFYLANNRLKIVVAGIGGGIPAVLKSVRRSCATTEAGRKNWGAETAINTAEVVAGIFISLARSVPVMIAGGVLVSAFFEGMRGILWKKSREETLSSALVAGATALILVGVFSSLGRSVPKTASHEAPPPQQPAPYRVVYRSGEKPLRVSGDPTRRLAGAAPRRGPVSIPPVEGKVVPPAPDIPAGYIPELNESPTISLPLVRLRSIYDLVATQGRAMKYIAVELDGGSRIVRFGEEGVVAHEFMNHAAKRVIGAGKFSYDRRTNTLMLDGSSTAFPSELFGERSLDEVYQVFHDYLGDLLHYTIVV